MVCFFYDLKQQKWLQIIIYVTFCVYCAFFLSPQLKGWVRDPFIDDDPDITAALPQLLEKKQIGNKKIR